MAEGDRPNKPLPETETGADAKADASAEQEQADTTGGEATPVCSDCRTRLDLWKVDERKCWLCGGADFTDPTEEEGRRRKQEAERRELCCPSPDCPRPVGLFPSTEKYCSECGAALEKATVELWFRKCVEHVVRAEPGGLVSGRAGFIAAAWLLNLSKEEADARLDEYAAASARAPAGETSEQTAPSGEPSSEPPSNGVVGALHAAPSARPVRHPAPAESYRRGKSSRVKYGVGIACVSALAALLIFVGRSVPEEEKVNVQPPPSTPPSATPPSATPPPATLTPPPMVLVGGGQFEMGRHSRDGGDEYESPAHTATVKPFMMDVYEVTREDYQKCVRAARCIAPPDWDGDTYPANTARLPVTGVTWEDANNYAAWAGKRLPSEEEWEFAARGTDGRLYPWGQAREPGRANLGGSGLAEVGKYAGASPFGVFDMLGNAQEWTASELRKYPDKSSYITTGVRPETLRVIRGGSYRDSARVMTATYRNALRTREERSYAQTGFRCVTDAPHP